MFELLELKIEERTNTGGGDPNGVSFIQSFLPVGG
jgi:hypothetical protein